jgi:hypothetical protein
MTQEERCSNFTKEYLDLIQKYDVEAYGIEPRTFEHVPSGVSFCFKHEAGYSSIIAFTPIGKVQRMFMVVKTSFIGLNPFIYKVVKFSNSKFGARKLTIKGFVFIMNRVHPCFTSLNRYTEDCIQFDNEMLALQAIENFKNYTPTISVVK